MATLHEDAVVVDCHHDIILLVARAREKGRPGRFADRWIRELRAGGVDVQVMPIHIESEYLPEGALRRTLQLLEMVHQEVEENSKDLALGLTGEEIDRALERGQIALVPALEGAVALGSDPSMVSLLFRLGIRMASFTWFGRTMLADGSGEETGSRLPRAGVEAVVEMERLGMLLDVSHLSGSGVDHVLEIASRPVIASHSSARALCDHHRNLTDEHLTGIAATGGVVAVNFFSWFIDAERPTIDRIIDHVEHIAEVGGIDHVGIGPDFVKDYFDEFYPAEQFPELVIEGLDARATIDGMALTQDLPRFTEALVARGWTPVEIRKVLGENFLRVFRQHMGVTRSGR